MMGLSIRGGLGVTRMARNLGNRAKNIGKGTAAQMEVVVKALERDLKLNQLTGTTTVSPFWGRGGAIGENKLAVKTGHTRRSIVSGVFLRGTAIFGVVGSRLASFAAHEFGAVIRGRPYLRIPTAWAKTPAGVDRLAGRSARTLSGTAIFKSRAGNLWIWEVNTPRSKGSGRGPIPLYLLKPSVRLRARHMLGTMLKRNLAYIQLAIQGAVTRVVRGQ